MKIINCTLEVELEPGELEVFLSEKEAPTEWDDSFLLTLENIYRELQSFDLSDLQEISVENFFGFKDWLFQTGNIQSFLVALDMFHSLFREFYDENPISMDASSNSRLSDLAYCAKVFAELAVPPAFLRLDGLKDIPTASIQILQGHLYSMRKIYDKYTRTVSLPEPPISAFADMYRYWLKYLS